MLRAAGRLATIVGALAAGLLGGPAPVFAECPYIPPWPRFSEAVDTAEEIVVGEIVPAVIREPDRVRDYALQVIEVIRGPAGVGDLRDVQYLLPNWPWASGGPGFPPFPSCNGFSAELGTVLVFAFDARFPGGELESAGDTWEQPPTQFHAASIIGPAPVVDAGEPAIEWEHLSIEDVRALAGVAAPAPPPEGDLLPIVAASGLAALVVGGVVRRRRA